MKYSADTSSSRKDRESLASDIRGPTSPKAVLDVRGALPRIA